MSVPIDESAIHAGLRQYELAMVRRLPLLQGIGSRDLARLLELATVREFERNHMLFYQGDKAGRFYVVLRGWVRIYRSIEDGSEVTINLFTDGEGFAEAALLAGGNYPVNGVTADRSRLLIIPAKGFLNYLNDNPSLCFNMMASMARKLQGFVRQVEQISHRTTTQRLAAFLATLTRGASGPCRLRLPLDKHLIAARLGMQPETFSRALAKLRKHGVHVDGEVVTIDDCNRLRALIGKDD